MKNTLLLAAVSLAASASASSDLLFLQEQDQDDLDNLLTDIQEEAQATREQLKLAEK